MQPKPKPPELLKCPKCSYQWWSNSKLDHITCPNCHRKFPREEGKIEEMKNAT